MHNFRENLATFSVLCKERENECKILQGGRKTENEENKEKSTRRDNEGRGARELGGRKGGVLYYRRRMKER